MRPFLSRIDASLLDRIEPVAHRVQRWTGFDCLDQARAGYAIAALAALTLMVQGLRQHNYGALANLLSFLMNAANAFFGSLNNDRIRSETSRGFRNFRRKEPAYELTRLFLLCCGVLFTPALAFSPGFVALLYGINLGVYLDGCDPLPPGTSKIREWLQSFRQTPQPATAEGAA